MRLIALAVALLLTAPAVAQEVGDTVTVSADTRSLRFPDADVTGPTFREGEELRVLFVEGGRVRLRRGDRYGWVEASAVTALSEDDAGLE